MFANGYFAGTVTASAVTASKLQGDLDWSYITNKPTYSLNDLSDVSLSSTSSGQVLQYNGSEWVNANVSSGGAQSLNDLSDVTISSPTTGQLLVYNGSDWVNSDTISAALTISGSVTPSSDNAYDLGSPSYRWANGYFGSKVGIGVTSIDAGALQLPYYPSSGSTTLLIGSNSDMGSNSFELGIALPSSAGHWPFGIVKGGTTLFRIDNNGKIANSLTPNADNTYDLGSSSYKWANAYFGGNVHIINSSGSIVAGLNSTGNVYIGFDLDMARTIDGDYNWKRALVPFTDTLVINYNGDFTSGVKVAGSVLEPYSDNSTDLGSSSLRWKNGYFSGYLYSKDFRFVSEPQVWYTLGYPDIFTPQALVPELAKYDVLLFNPPSTYEYNDGSGWTTGTIDDSIKNLFTARGSWTGFTITNGWTGVRFTWSNIPYSFFETFYMDVNCYGNPLELVLEASADGSTWTTVFDVTGISNWPGPVVIKQHFSNSDYNPYLRLTIYPTWNNTNNVAIGRIRLLSVYPNANDNLLTSLFWWDYNKNIGPSTDNSQDLGSSSLRWKDGHFAGTVYSRGGSLYIGDSSDTSLGNIYLYLHSGYTGVDDWNIHTGTGGFFIEDETASANRLQINNSGVLYTQSHLPLSNDTYDLGGSSNRWANGYLSQLLHLTFNSLNIGITADNYVDALYVNGINYTTSLANSSSWNTADFVDVETGLPYTVIAIACHNADTTSPAGLLLRIKDKFGDILLDGRDVSEIKVYYSTSSTPPSSDWYAIDYDDSSWGNATQVAQYGSGPWNSNVTNWDDSSAWWIWANNEGTSDTPNTQYVWFRIKLYNFPVRLYLRSLIPSADNTYNLGSSSYKWGNGYFAGTISTGSVEASTITASTVNCNTMSGYATKYDSNEDGLIDINALETNITATFSVPSNTIYSNSNTYSTTSTSWVKIASYTVSTSDMGTPFNRILATISGEISSIGALYSAYLGYSINGGSIIEIGSVSGATYYTKSVSNVELLSGDTVDFYLKVGNSSYTAYAKNLQIIQTAIKGKIPVKEY